MPVMCVGQPIHSVGCFFLWTAEHLCMSLPASGMVKDSPVLRTISRGLKDKTVGPLSQTANKGIVIINISTVKTTFFCGHASNLPQSYRNPFAF